MCPLISPSFSLVNTFIFLSFFFLPHVSGHAEGYTACAPFSCGNFTGISYPFWSNKQPDYCGHPKFKLGCQQDNLTIDINSQKFHVIDINPKSQLLKIARLDLWNGDDPSCPKQYINVSLDVAFFSYTSSDDSCYLLFDCGPYNSSGNLEPAMGFSCLTDDDAHDGYLVLSTKVGNFIDLGCKNNITVPVLKQALQSSLPVTVSDVLAEGFEVGWSGVDEEKCDGCMKSAGRCGYNASQNAFMCLCGPNQQSNGGICNKTPALSPLPAPSRDASKHVAEKQKKLMGTAVGVIIFGFITCVSVMMLRKQVAMGVCYFAPFQRRQESLRLRKEDTDLPMFDLSIIVKATNNFSSENKLGEGGFGPVYKGTLIDGNEVAIKRHSKRSDQGLEEFKNEVGLIAKLQHRNLVKLLGCCIQGEEKLLIYEYMPNKSLDYFIFDETRSKLLAWLQRFHIIGGIARGLLYLHQNSRLRIIHRDLKTSNILLDAYMNPKISDFGLARTFRGDQIEAKTKRMVGTYGYMPPEYVMHGHYSVKSDVFSFGVIMLEIVSGNKNKGFCDPEHSLNLLGHAWRLLTEDRPLELLDQHLLEPSSSFQVLRCIHVGLLCVQQEPGDRPDMPSVILMLNGEKLLPQPKAPGFYTGRGLPDAVSPSSNQMSLTTFEAR